MRGQEPLRIVLLISSKLRDLAGLAYFKVLLTTHLGAEVTLVNALNWPHLLTARPHLVMIPSIWNPSQSVSIVRFLKQRGILVAFLPTEGVLRCDEEVSLIYGDSIETLQEIDLTFVWGEELRRILKQYYNLAPQTLELCGSLRFDLYRPPLSALYYTDRASFCARLGLNPHWPIVTWATGYPGAERFRERQDRLTEENFKGLQIPGFTGLEFARMQLAAQDAAFAGMKTLVRALPQVNFVVKVRPDETTRLYDEAFGEAGRRVAIVKSEPIFTLAQASDVWVHWNSTTSSEAWFFERPTVNLFLGTAREYALEELGRGSVPAYTEDDLYDLVQRFLKDPAIPAQLAAARETFITKWFYKIDGLAGMRHVGAVERLLARCGVPATPRLDWPMMRATGLATVKRMLGREPYDSIRFWAPPTGDLSGLATRAEIREQEATMARGLGLGAKAPA